MRIAWFSPLPPDPSGIAAYSAEIIPLLEPLFGAIDLYTADRHDFVWRHRRNPYDLVVYQMGNSAAHDFIWAYLFRYPGLLVLHDAQLHQARALWLLRRLEPRRDDYFAELAANHPDAPAELGHLFADGLGGHLFRLWPFITLPLRVSKLAIVHSAHLAGRLARSVPDAAIRPLDMGVADPLPGPPESVTDPPFHDEVSAIGAGVRRKLGIADDACVVGAFGGMTPEKRIPQLLESVAALGRADLHVLLVGQALPHYDVTADICRLGLGSRVHVTGYVPDAALPAHLAAVDICWCLRWPSNGETSASWLRCLAAGRPTLITALAQLGDVPALRVNETGVAPVTTCVDAVGIAIDPVDERRDIAAALTTLADSPALRAALGANARRRWASRHTLPRMAEGYLRLITEAAGRPAPSVSLPPHLLDDGSRTGRTILAEMGLAGLPW